jgi:hypothetical protein
VSTCQQYFPKKCWDNDWYDINDWKGASDGAADRQSGDSGGDELELHLCCGREMMLVDVR